MKLKILFQFSIFGSLFIFPTTNVGQLYQVDCSVQQTDAYRWGTSFAYLVAAITTGVVPPLTIRAPEGAGNAVGSAATSILRFLWPLIIGVNDDCARQAIEKMLQTTEKLVNAKVKNGTLNEIRLWFDGQSDTAKKIYEWIPVIKSASDDYTKRQASLEFLKEVKYLYLSANEARKLFIGSVTGDASSFLFMRELAFIQFGAAAEIVGNQYTESIVKKKFMDDYMKDVEFYWKASHTTVEKLVACLPSDKMGKARISLSTHLKPLYDFAHRFLSKNTSAIYDRSLVYHPINSGDFVGLRNDQNRLVTFEEIFRLALLTTSNETCPACGWNLFDQRFSPSTIRKSFEKRKTSNACLNNVFSIGNNRGVGTTLQSCDIVSLNYRPIDGSMPDLSLQTPIFMIDKFDPLKNNKLACGQTINDRDHVLFSPTKQWASKVSSLDVIIIKSN